jgi:hypothetical protein
MYNKVGCFLLVLLLVGCGSKPNSLVDVLAGMDDFPNWSPVSSVELFDRENIYALVNGQADAFFAYAFEQVAVRRYESTEGARLDVEVWQVATPADAYGLFAASIAGTPTSVGSLTGSDRHNNGDTDPGWRLAFWQNRYYVQVRARQELPDADLRRFAETVSAALPSEGERPALVDRLPSDGPVERSALFFHQEISIQSELWLGGENLLGLSDETDGVLARYDAGGAVVRLLLVQYPNAEAASAGLAALESGQVSSLVTADVHDDLLGAVLGEIDGPAASTLLAEALQ